MMALDAVVQLASRGVERIANRDVHVLVRPIATRLARDHDTSISGDGDLDPHVIEMTVTTTSTRARQRNTAVGDALVVPTQSGGALANRRFDRR